MFQEKYKKTAQSHIDQQTKKSLTQIYLNPDKLTIALKRYQDFYQQLETLKSNDYLWLSYEEDILNDPQVAFEKVSNFLDLELIKPTIYLGKTNPEPLSTIIINFVEISSFLKNSNSEWMLSS